MAKKKKSKDNPSSSTILQALLDLKNNGYGGFSVEGMIEHLREDKELLSNLDKQFNNRLYSQESIEWASVTINDGWMNLTPEAIKLLLFLGTHADQTALIRAKQDILIKLTRIKRTTLKEAFRELERYGAIKVEVPAAGHKAPIYRVNGKLIAVGRRNKQFDFEGNPEEYILKQEYEELKASGLELVCSRHTDHYPDGTKLMYHELTLVPKKENEPSDTEAPEGPLNIRNNNSTKAGNSGQDDIIPGQMDISDFDGLPFG